LRKVPRSRNDGVNPDSREALAPAAWWGPFRVCPKEAKPVDIVSGAAGSHPPPRLIQRVGLTTWLAVVDAGRTEPVPLGIAVEAEAESTPYAVAAATRRAAPAS
jgi:hypothetical protein